ncbi:TonB-dependent receptor [Bowmanella denitrificans]|uniref:TonB-dependent receptor n=1 Tax=Bowmanella denitrificans TaxID=366582 RepID=A0ABN0X4D2_9ALTE
MHKVLTKTAMAVSMAVSLPSFAQDTISDTQDTVENISVTGSRIMRTSAQMTTPTTVIDAQTIKVSGVKNIGELLHQMPALVDGIGSTNINDNDDNDLGKAGLQLANLRGLGQMRTLVLVDGRRHVPGAAGEASVDLSMIPVELVERVEIITGGASAIYGADAVTGVVNFIMRKNYDGLALDASVGRSSRSDADNRDVSLSFGQNFADNRANLTFHLNYSKQDEVPMTARDYANQRPSFLANPENTGPDDGIPNTVFTPDIRFQALSEEGVFYVPNDNWVLAGTPFDIINNPLPPTFADDPFGLGYDTFIIDRDSGQFRDFIPGKNCAVVPCDGGDGFRTAETNTLRQPTERYLANISGNYDVTDNLSLFSNLKYGKVESAASGQASVFHDDNFGPLIAIRSDNPFRPQELVDVMTARNLDVVALAVVGLNSRNVNKRETLQFTFGGEGFWRDYGYNFYVQHGKVESSSTSQDVLNERYYEALDATTDAQGNPVCRSGNSACVPFNPINNQASQAAIDYVAVTLRQEDEIKQTLASFSLNGDLFELPAGMVAFAAGLEYRKESSSSIPDPLAQAVDADGVGSGLVGSRTGPSREENSYLNPVKGSFDVKEIFGEAIVPLLEDTPVSERVELELAARLANHSETGSDVTYKSALNWTFNDMFRLRGTYSKAVRAPNIQELFAPNSIAGARVTDPCHNTELDNGRDPQNRRANCQALGIDENFVSEASFGTRQVVTRGNLALKPEEADTLTLGLVVTPTQDLNMAIDFWDIEITDAITSFDASDVLANCVDGAGLNEEFCSLIKRDGEGQINNISVQNINASKFAARGTDLDISYRYALGDGELGLTFKGTYLDKREFRQNPNDPEDISSLAGRWDFPRVRAQVNTVYSTGSLTLAWGVNYVGESTFNKTAQPEEYPDWFDNKVPSYFKHNLHLGYGLTENINLYLDINNLTDKQPAFLPNINSGGTLYDGLGRYYTAGINVRM